MVVFYGREAVFPFYEILDHSRAYGSGAVEGDDGYYILEIRGFQLIQDVAHTRTFKLEDPESLRVRKELVCFGVIERHIVEIDGDAFCPLDYLYGLVYYGQGPQAEEVHFEQAYLFERFHFVPGGELALRCLKKRHVIRQRLIGYHDAGGVRRGVAVESFQFRRDIYKLPDLGVALVKVAQLRLYFERLFQRYPQFFRDELRYPVDVAVADTHHASDVPDHRAGFHRTECDDLRDILLGIFLCDVFDHLAPSLVAEVYVDIRQAYAVRVKEAFEDEVVLYRVKVGYTEGIADDASSGRTSSRPHRYALRLRVVDEIPRDQEVAGKAGLLYDVEFVFYPVFYGFIYGEVTSF